MEHGYIHGDVPARYPAMEQGKPCAYEGPMELLKPSALLEALAQQVADLKRSNTELTDRVRELEWHLDELMPPKL